MGLWNDAVWLRKLTGRKTNSSAAKLVRDFMRPPTGERLETTVAERQRSKASPVKRRGRSGEKNCDSVNSLQPVDELLREVFFRFRPQQPSRRPAFFSTLAVNSTSCCTLLRIFRSASGVNSTSS